MTIGELPSSAGIGARQAAALVACAAGFVVAPPVAGQRVVEVSGEVSCLECRITMDTVLTIGGLDGPGSHLVDDASRVLVDHRGRILVTTTPSNEIAVFSADGKFLREIGGTGEGPGEYYGITNIYVGPKYVHVFDLNGRTLLDADHNFVRRDVFWAQSGAATVTESEMVVHAGDVPTSESFGHHLHTLHEDGSVRSYGWDGPDEARGPTWRWFAVAANDTAAWLADGGSGRVEVWALVPAPKLSRVFYRRIEEFDRGATDRLWPSTSNNRAQLNDRGLWILWTAPDPNWSLRTSDPEIADQWFRAMPKQVIQDGVLDLVDPATGRTLARHRSDLPLPGFVGGSDMVTAYEENEAGVPRLHLLRPKLHPRQPRRHPIRPTVHR